MSNKVTESWLPSVNFSKCGIPVGAELVYIENPEIKVIVCDDHKVQFGDELTSLSAVAKNFKGYPVAGPRFFTYNGKTVAEMRNEKVISQTKGQVYAAVTDSGLKSFYLLTDQEYSMKITARDKGKMDVSVTEYSLSDGMTKQAVGQL